MRAASDYHMPSKTATDYDRPKAVLFTHSFNGLTLEDVIGMGPTRPTLEQVRAVDFVMEMTESGTYVAHPTSAESHIDIYGQVVWDGSAFRCRCGARYQAKFQQQPTVAPRLSQGADDVLTRLAPLVQGLRGTRAARLQTIEAACLCDDLGEAGKTVATELRALFNQHDVPVVNLSALVRLLAPHILMEAPGHATRVDGVSQADHVKSPKRGDMWRTSDGCVCLVVDSVGYSNKYDASRVFFWRRGKLDNCEPSDFGLVLTSLNAASVDCPEKEGA